MPAFQPYRGKLAVRNDRGDRGNVGIIRSPIRASILPDHMRHSLFASEEEISSIRASLGMYVPGLFSQNNYVCLYFLKFPQ
jgi:hypothetical protein